MMKGSSVIEYIPLWTGIRNPFSFILWIYTLVTGGSVPMRRDMSRKVKTSDPDRLRISLVT
jgi:hypothetical protein